MARNELDSTAARVREQIEKGGDRYWRLSDFSRYPPAAVAQAFSRLASEGSLERVHKGLYYKPRETPYGSTIPSSSSLTTELPVSAPIFTAGTAAANLLGFSTQSPMRPEFATPAHYVPGILKDAIVNVGRPESWRQLEAEEGALLSFLRDRGRTSELDSVETATKLITIFRDSPKKYEHLIEASKDEPARVRAMLGAIGQEIGVKESILKSLRDSLSVYSCYDFGRLKHLKFAKEWQAK